MKTGKLCMALVLMLPLCILCGDGDAVATTSFDMDRLIREIDTVFPHPVLMKDGWMLKQYKAEDRTQRIEDIGIQADALVGKICATSDVTLLKPLLERKYTFNRFTGFLASAQRKAVEHRLESPEMSHAIMDYVIRNAMGRGKKRHSEMTPEESMEEFRNTWLPLSLDDEQYARIVLTLRFPEEHYSDGMLDFLSVMIMEGRSSWTLYFHCPPKLKLRLRPQLVKYSSGLRAKGSHLWTSTVPLYATVLLAYDGDVEAVDKLCQYLGHLRECDISNDCMAACALSRQRKVVDALIHIMRTDTRVKFIGYDCEPSSLSFRGEAAIALSLIDPSFPKYDYPVAQDGMKDDGNNGPAKDDPQLRKCLEWLETHEISLDIPDGQPIVPLHRVVYFKFPNKPVTIPESILMK